MLNVTRTDVGEGWWEGEISLFILLPRTCDLRVLNTAADDQYYWIGTRPNGETGLFPEAYVEEVQEEGPPAMAPPPLPQVLFCKLPPYCPSVQFHLLLAGLQQPAPCTCPEYFRHIQPCWWLEQVDIELWTSAFTVETFSDPWAGVAGGMAPPQQQTNDWGAGADVSLHHQKELWLIVTVWMLLLFVCVCVIIMFFVMILEWN